MILPNSECAGPGEPGEQREVGCWGIRRLRGQPRPHLLGGIFSTGAGVRGRRKAESEAREGRGEKGQGTGKQERAQTWTEPSAAAWFVVVVAFARDLLAP